MALVETTGNPEMARVHREVRDPAPYRRGRAALRSHIEASKAEVRKITLHRLYTARQTHSG